MIANGIMIPILVSLGKPGLQRQTPVSTVRPSEARSTVDCGIDAHSGFDGLLPPFTHKGPD